MSGLAGRAAWVTGGGSGIGAAAARALAEAGAAVTISGRRREALERVAAGSARIAPLVLDVTDAPAVERTGRGLGEVDILVANAGTNIPRRRFAEVSLADWHMVLDTNLKGVMHVVQAVLPGMRARGTGLVVVVSSWIGWRNEKLAGSAYAASKRALLALVESLNMEEGPSGIRATALCPAEVDTEVLETRPVPPPAEERAGMLRADDIGRLIRFLAEQPPHVCVNEITISPVQNRFYR
ncbi:MAG TPA: SDR family NAD(P)-dependent oxidoreductase [Geminicoccaceae bacterium]|nr:SDR family NAD(P)-dependent oxidoreductase [Geminicoccus sp.]HMU52751.1 SDR family NAD(P)-dependent oxidoreductase [Geminicoccaceae bacterium]